jgi:hypothetical protein
MTVARRRIVHRRIGGLVHRYEPKAKERRMLKLHKDLPKAKTPREQESIQRQIAASDKSIDALVYGLMEDEIRIVEDRKL